jgi:hypothetical protein
MFGSIKNKLNIGFMKRNFCDLSDYNVWRDTRLKEKYVKNYKNDILFNQNINTQPKNAYSTFVNANNFKDYRYYRLQEKYILNR